MEINQSLNNALKLADLDFNRIQYVVEEEFSGSLNSYFIYVNQLATEFESALSGLVLEYKPEQIITFARLNLTKIEIAINQIKVFEELCSRSQIQIDSDPVNSGLLDGYFRPIQNAHLSQLVYIEKLLKDVLENVGGKITSTEVSSETVSEIQVSEKEVLPMEIDLLSDYGEFLSMADMTAIFKVKRDAIYKKESAGHFKRCSLKNQTVLFNKEDIKRYLSSK